PGDLQKGISWPDPRANSDAIIRDRNVEAARYFLNAMQLDVGAKPVDAERQLMEAIVQLPAADVPAAYEIAATKAGPADQIVKELKEVFPSLPTDYPAISSGPGTGFVRPNKIAARRLRVRAEGIDILIPPHVVNNVSWEQSGDEYVITIRVASEPQWDAG
ncbi:MAG: hypothetical protein M3290_01520, partial [Actinomycetota bacterium]|nr:hypothetical protein [Actinomycetota bacterium]